MFIPIWLLLLALALVAVLGGWAVLVASGRNPMPFPDKGSRIFSATSPEAKDAMVALLARHGIRERFQFDSSGIRRSIMWDGTIINVQPAEVYERLGSPAASIALVAADPVSKANEAAQFLRKHGFAAEVILDAEPELPIAFVATDAFVGTVLTFRKHIIHMPRPK